MDLFLSPSPDVRLVNLFHRPFDNAIATARTCYSRQGIVSPEEDGADEGVDTVARSARRKERDDLAGSIYRAGHHTTFQHAHVQFTLQRVSRLFVWSFLHSHPFYNSEQVSQRYVEVDPASFAIPPLSGQALSVYRQTIASQVEAYHGLTELLMPLCAREYWRVFPSRARRADDFSRIIKRKALEISRYVLPIAAFTSLYHTVSVLTLLRYYRLCRTGDVPHEQRLVVGRMVEELLGADPSYEVILEAPLDAEETPESRIRSDLGDRCEDLDQSGSLAAEFDESLDGHVSRLIDYKMRNEEVLAASVREVLGLRRDCLHDRDAVAAALCPERNRLLGESLNLTTHSKLSRALSHPSYTFRKKLSHTADSQDQRHRMTPASRPCMKTLLSEEPDVVVPGLVGHSDEALDVFTRSVGLAWSGINRLREEGVPDEYALYLLPNATAVRFTESADLLNLRHKLAMRLCYNSQEEIWRASRDEVLQVREINPEIGRYLLPPCGLRIMAGARPVCPEGDRFCGVEVWRKDPAEYQRVI